MACGAWDMSRRQPAPDEPATVGVVAGLRIARLPAEAPRPFAQACQESAAAEGMPGLRINRGFIANAQLDGVQPTGDCQLIHRRFEREHAGALARRAHPRGRRHIEPCKPVRGRAVRRGVHHTCDDGGLLGEFLKGRGLLDDLMRDGCQPTVVICAQADALDRRRAIAGHRKHVLPCERELYRSTNYLRGHHGENDVWMGGTF